MTKALSTQVGGSHYKGLKIEPFTFALVNHYDAACFSILKYVTRHATKNGAQCLGKARHICFIRADELPEDNRVSARDFIPISRYLEENAIPPREASILVDLHDWARGRLETLTDRQAAEWIANKIARLSLETYGKDSQ